MRQTLGTAEQSRRHGPQIVDHGVSFNLWAPTARSVELLEAGQPPRRMPRGDDGWYQMLSPTARAGTRYQFRINEDLVVPDPASCFQPDDVGGPSEVIDPAALRDPVLYPGRPWAEAVIYELHVGTFSEEGTYAGVEKKLAYLRDLGVTAIELMPLNDVPGRHNWGYDGVLLNAPNARYGRPEDLKRLLRAAHALDIMVYLDVVYNHFGPQLNYLHLYAENFFNPRHATGWVGNRAFGERLSRLIGPEKLELALALVLLSPHIPMLFMGEEAAADTPFLFFANWTGEAAELTREGRRREFSHFKAFATPETRARIPDPCDEGTFLASKLDWTSIDQSAAGARFRALTTRLLTIRREKIVPLIKSGFVSAQRQLLGADPRMGGVDVRWQTESGDVLQIVANFAGHELPMPALVDGESLWRLRPHVAGGLRPGDIIVRLGRKR
ncbi:alpha-amylase family glycosyl hydrolase [Bradyrhizobium liaoningense]